MRHAQSNSCVTRMNLIFIQPFISRGDNYGAGCKGNQNLIIILS